MMADSSGYAKRKSTARLFVGAQIGVKSLPAFLRRRDGSYMDDLWGKGFNSRETEPAEPGIREYRWVSPMPGEFARSVSERAPDSSGAPRGITCPRNDATK